MPVNTNFCDASNASPPLQRVICNLTNQLDRDAFIEALKNVLTLPPVSLVYLATIEIQQSDRDAAERIGWLRKNAFSVGESPTNQDITGALGEWALLRSLKLNASVQPVSLVSLAPESKPDVVIQFGPCDVRFDIKTSGSQVSPLAYFDPALHAKKGEPHLIGVHLNDKWNKATRADIYFIHAGNLMTVEEYEQFCTNTNSRSQVVYGLGGNII